MSGALMSNKPIESLIFAVRGQKVIIDRDLAQIYGVKTSRLNEQVKRNIARFPEDFVFQLTRNEAQTWLHSRSQIAILKPGQNIKYLPFAFTEHGAIMAANVLKSSLANQMSVFVVRAFIKMRGIATAHRELSQRLSELEKRVDMSDEKIQVILKAVRQLMAPPEKAPKKIGFKLREKRASYGKN
jgi:hypothetical protein